MVLDEVADHGDMTTYEFPPGVAPGVLGENKPLADFIFAYAD
jgi:hypothetical protein